MHLAEENDFPTVARDEFVERGPFSPTKKAALDPLPSAPAADGERDGGGADAAGGIEEKAPPQAEEESAAHGHDSARQEADIARRIQHRIKHAAPDFHAPDGAL